MKTQDINLKIKSIYRDLSSKEKMIADFILLHPEKVMHGTISNISDTIQVADATFFRFCKRLGYNGFQDFKIALASEKVNSSLSIHENISKEDNELLMAQKVFDSNVKSLNDTKKLLDEQELIKAVQFLTVAKTVGFFGVGGSSIIAMDAYHKFLRTPLNSTYTQDTHIQMMQASRLTENDCAIIISHSGITKDTIQLAEIIKEKKAKVIVITSYSLSPLAKFADALLLSTAEETDYRSEALTSRITQLSLIDALFVSVMFKTGDFATHSLEKVRKVISQTKL